MKHFKVSGEKITQSWFNIFKDKLDLESIKSSLKMDFEKGGISIRIDRDS